MATKQNIFFILGISIPIIMALFIIASIYFPRFFFHPQYNFLYSIETGSYFYSSQALYTVHDGKLVQNEIRRSEDSLYFAKRNGEMLQGETAFYIYDVKKNESKFVNYEEAQRLQLDPARQSPDEYEVMDKIRNFTILSKIFPPFGGDDSQYLVGHNGKEKLNISPNQKRPFHFYFLGWIK